MHGKHLMHGISNLPRIKLICNFARRNVPQMQFVFRPNVLQVYDDSDAILCVDYNCLIKKRHNCITFL